MRQSPPSFVNTFARRSLLKVESYRCRPNPLKQTLG